MSSEQRNLYQTFNYITSEKGQGSKRAGAAQNELNLFEAALCKRTKESGCDDCVVAAKDYRSSWVSCYPIPVDYCVVLMIYKPKDEYSRMYPSLPGIFHVEHTSAVKSNLCKSQYRPDPFSPTAS